MPPSNHQSGKLYQWVDKALCATPPPLPEWIAALGAVNGSERAVNGSERSSDIVEIEFTELAEAVLALPQELCDDYQEWIKVGAAIYHQTNGDKSGYALFDQWSRLSNKYTSAGDTRRKWNSFGRWRHSRPITARSILQKARENGWEPWSETPAAFGYTKISGDVLLCVATLAIEEAEYGDRSAMRGHCLPVAMEVAKGNLDEQAARELLTAAAANVGISDEEFTAMFDGALRFQRQEYALQRFLEDERLGIGFATEEQEEMAEALLRERRS